MSYEKASTDLSELQIATLVAKYLRERDRFDKMAAIVARQLSSQLRASAIPHLPTFRSKDPESLRNKLTTDRERHDFRLLEREFAPSVLDLAGVRILLYRQADIDPTCAVIESIFDVPPETRFRRDHAAPDGYQARHRVVSLRKEVFTTDTALANLEDVVCEIQVVTFGDHIWNELEHDIRYKTPAGPPNHEQASLLEVLRDQLDAVRSTVDLLSEATEHQKLRNLTAIETPEDLSDVLRVRVGRRQYGDFGRLLELLKGALPQVTRSVIDHLPIDQPALDEARLRLSAAGVDNPDDVAVIVSALWPTFGSEFLEISTSWKGRPGVVARLIQRLNQARIDGTI